MTVLASSEGLVNKTAKLGEGLRAEVCRPSISVIGLGYVGAVSMACLSHLGFRMVGVDVSFEKVRAIKEGRAPTSRQDWVSCWPRASKKAASMQLRT
jgi:UDP-N-acetyl-D-mannosaminuronate dehydrogenase